jgi:hypothetical protein
MSATGYATRKSLFKEAGSTLMFDVAAKLFATAKLLTTVPLSEAKLPQMS